jgi:hypothetical protein
MAAKSSQPPAPEPQLQPVLRSIAEYALVVVGCGLLFLGWYGISGTANVAQQLPLLASATLPGVALIISGAVLLASDRTRRSNQRASDMVDSLYQLLTEAVEDGGTAELDRAEESPGAGPVASGKLTPGLLVTVADGTRFHRPECALVDHKRSVELVDPSDIAGRHLTPCPICDPPAPAG